MYCSNCGSQFEGKFCPDCGTAAPAGDGSQQAGEAPPASQEPQAQQPPPAAAGGMTDNVAATLCYVLGFVTGIVFLILEPYNRNKEVRFHAFQSIILSVVWIVFSIALNIILPWQVSLMLGPLISLAGFILWVFLLIKTYQGSKVVLPVIGPMAEKQA